MSFRDVYEIIETISHGTESIFYSAINRNTRQNVIVRCINRSPKNIRNEIVIKQEVKLLKSLSHPSLVRIIDFIEEEEYLYVAMESVEGGALFDRIANKAMFNEEEARDLMQKILQGVKYCHDNNVVFRDFKLQNLQFKSSLNDFDIKITDFGYTNAKITGLGLPVQWNKISATSDKVIVNASETNGQLCNECFGKPIDMWHIGVITYILVGGYPPFRMEDAKSPLFRKVKKDVFEFFPNYWTFVSNDAKHFIKKLLVLDASARLTVDSALAHPWMQRDGYILAKYNLIDSARYLKKYYPTKKFRFAIRSLMDMGNLTEPEKSFLVKQAMPSFRVTSGRGSTSSTSSSPLSLTGLTSRSNPNSSASLIVSTPSNALSTSRSFNTSRNNNSPTKSRNSISPVKYRKNTTTATTAATSASYSPSQLKYRVNDETVSISRNVPLYAKPTSSSALRVPTSTSTSTTTSSIAVSSQSEQRAISPTKRPQESSSTPLTAGISSASARSASAPRSYELPTESSQRRDVSRLRETLDENSQISFNNRSSSVPRSYVIPSNTSSTRTPYALVVPTVTLLEDVTLPITLINDISIKDKNKNSYDTTNKQESLQQSSTLTSAKQLIQEVKANKVNISNSNNIKQSKTNIIENRAYSELPKSTSIRSPITEKFIRNESLVFGPICSPKSMESTTMELPPSVSIRLGLNELSSPGSQHTVSSPRNSIQSPASEVSTSMFDNHTSKAVQLPLAEVSGRRFELSPSDSIRARLSQMAVESSVSSPTNTRPEPPTGAPKLFAQASIGTQYSELDETEEWEQPMSGFRSKYELGEMVVDGPLMIIYIAKNRETGHTVAVKCILRESLSHAYKDLIHEEVRVLCMLDHPNVIKCLDFYEEPDRFFMVMEIIHGGFLCDRIRTRTTLSENEVRDVLKNLLLAVQHFHGHHIVHRGLTYEHLLVSSEDNIRDVVVADFGFATTTTLKQQKSSTSLSPSQSSSTKNLDKEVSPRTTTTDETAGRLVAHEILDANEEIDEKAFDMYAIGVIAFTMLGSYPPFQDSNTGDSKLQHFSCKFNPIFWDVVSLEGKSFVASLLTMDITKRLTVAEALQHPWMLLDNSVLAAHDLTCHLATLRKNRGGVKKPNGNIPIKLEASKRLSKEKTEEASPLKVSFTEKYDIGEVLGEGAFSVVHLATNRGTGQRVAAKCVNRTSISAADEESLREEVSILQATAHPNIVKCYDFFEEKDAYYVIMELVEGGELFDRIVEKSWYNEKDARDLTYLLLSAIKHLHDRDIVHRDLKPQNILLLNHDDDIHIKLCDFGFATTVAGTEQTLTTICGSPSYIAPEIVSNQAYGKAVDMWSIGVITFILVGGYPPFRDDDQKKLFRKIKKGKFEFDPDYWEFVSDEAKDFITKLLVLDPEKRMTATEALAHPWAFHDELHAINLAGSLANLKKSHCTSKLRACVRTIISLGRMHHMLTAAHQK